MEAILALESGKVFRGKSFGATGERFGEVVFNTSMAGYQEILTDPSYKGQMVAMTYPLIGNYGINSEDVESRQPFLEGFIVKEESKIASNWRCKNSLGEYLKGNNILGIEGIDTRRLTLHIREAGAMKAVLSTEDLDEKSLVKKVKGSQGLIGIDLVKEVTCKRRYIWSKISATGALFAKGTPLRGQVGHPVVGAGRAKGRIFKVVVLDCGVKYNILRELMRHHCEAVVVPAYTKAGEILKLKPHGVLLSNGPGDPEAVKYVIQTTQGLIGKVPIFGICLGQQMLGLAFGGKTYKLKFGHHGANQPVKDLETGKISITVQNHGFCVDINSLNKKEIEITHINLNDQTLEGLRHKKLPIFSVQFHPEASAGPHDAQYLFGQFIEMMKNSKH